MKTYTIINTKTFQEVDLNRGSKEVMQEHLEELKRQYPEHLTRNLTIMEVA